MDEAYQQILSKTGGTPRLQPEHIPEVRNALIQGLTQSYEINTDAASKEVDKFLQIGRATSSNLSRLERRVQLKAAKASGQAGTATSDAVSQFSVGTTRSGIKAQYGVVTPRLNGVPEDACSVSSQPLSARSSLSMTGKKMLEVGIPKGKDWSNVAKYAHLLDEQDKYRQKAGITALRQRMRSELDRQVAEQKDRAQQEKEHEKKWFESQCEEWQEWRNMEKVKKDRDKAKAEDMKEAREEQVNHLRKLRADEVKKKKDEDMELVQKVAVEVEKEKQQAEEKKQANKQAMFKLLKESGEERRVKEEKRRKQVQDEIENMKEYNKMLDAQDDRKKVEAAQRREKQVELAEKMKVIVAQQNASKGDLDQQLATRQKEEADARAVACIQYKEDRLREMRMQNQAFLFQQMAEKEERKQNEKDLKKLQADILEAETKSFLEIEKQRSKARRQKNVAHRMDLEDQIQVKAPTSRDAMSTHEYLMNQQILELADDLHCRSSPK
jgi:hypothetical protein